MITDQPLHESKEHEVVVQGQVRTLGRFFALAQFLWVSRKHFVIMMTCKRTCNCMTETCFPNAKSQNQTEMFSPHEINSSTCVSTVATSKLIHVRLMDSTLHVRVIFEHSKYGLFLLPLLGGVKQPHFLIIPITADDWCRLLVDRSGETVQGMKNSSYSG